MTHSPGLPEPIVPNLRIGTPEREAVVERLSAALGDGRLDVVEYDERVRQVYVAKTYADLVPITADLPPAPPPPAPKPSLLDRLRPAERSWLFVAVLLTGLWALQSLKEHDLNDFWFVWPVGVYGAIVLAGRVTRH